MASIPIVNFEIFNFWWVIKYILYIFEGSDQKVDSQAKEYPGKKSEVPFENQTSSWINAALYGDFKNQVPAEDRQQKFSKSRKLFLVLGVVPVYSFA